MCQWRIPEHWSNHRQSLHVAKDHSDEVTEEHKEAVALQKEAQCREKEPSDDYHEESGKEYDTSRDFALSHEEANCVLGSDYDDQAHDEGKVADTEESSIQKE